jgi:hypothetical protein
VAIVPGPVRISRPGTLGAELARGGCAARLPALWDADCSLRSGAARDARGRRQSKEPALILPLPSLAGPEASLCHPALSPIRDSAPAWRASVPTRCRAPTALAPSSASRRAARSPTLGSASCPPRCPARAPRGPGGFRRWRRRRRARALRHLPPDPPRQARPRATGRGSPRPPGPGPELRRRPVRAPPRAASTGAGRPRRPGAVRCRDGDARSGGAPLRQRPAGTSGRRGASADSPPRCGRAPHPARPARSPGRGCVGAGRGRCGAALGAPSTARRAGAGGGPRPGRGRRGDPARAPSPGGFRCRAAAAKAAERALALAPAPPLLPLYVEGAGSPRSPAGRRPARCLRADRPRRRLGPHPSARRCDLAPPLPRLAWWPSPR